MISPMLLCAISDRNPGAEDGRGFLLRQATRLALEGVDFFQLREKDLPGRELASLSRALIAAVRHTPTKILLNGRVDVAIAIAAPGVHLTSKEDELLPAQVRQLYAGARLPPPVITASCHTLEDVRRRREQAVHAILFGPVFGKVVRDKRLQEGCGVELLREACLTAQPVPVLALGGVTAANGATCLAAGAGGIAGIRLFQQ